MGNQTPPKRTGKPGTKNLVLFAASSLFALLVVLAFLAVDFYRADARLEVRDAGSTSAHEPDDTLGWRPKPNSSCRHTRPGDFDVTYTIDGEGFRKMRRVPSPALTVTFYGDSYTFGHGVNDEETFASVLADVYLTEDVNVYNAGVEGYGIVQMYGLFLERLETLKPGDVVVFGPTASDIQRNLADFVFPYTCAFRRGPNQASIEYYPVYADGGVTPVRLERTFANKLKLLALTAPGTRGFWEAVLTRSKPDTTREALEMVERAREETQRRGGRFLLVFLPRISECIERAYQVDVSGFDHRDLMAYFPTDKQDLYRLRFARDSHWNAAGHRLVAQAIAHTLRAESYIADTYWRSRQGEDLSSN